MLRKGVYTLSGKRHAQITPKLSITETSYASQVGGRGTYFSFPSMPIGTPNTTRRVIVAAGGRVSGSYLITEVTINGVPAKIRVRARQEMSPVVIADLVVPSGETADIALTFGGPVTNDVFVVVSLLEGAADVVAVETINPAATSGSISGTISGAANGIVYGACLSGTGNPVWSGLSPTRIMQGVFDFSVAESDEEGAISVGVVASWPFMCAVTYAPVVSGWLPSNLGNLFAWFDASDTATITESGGLVEQWADKSANENHTIQLTETAKPTTGIRTINGLNVLNFDGTQFLTKTGLTLSQPLTVLSVYQPDGVSGSSGPVVGRSGGMYFGRNDTSTRWNTWMESGRELSIGGPTIDLNKAYLLTTVVNGEFSLFQINSTLRKVTGHLGYTSGDRIMVGDLNAIAGNGLDGAVAEIVIYSSILSTLDLLILENYLMNKWGIT